jgi:hypothetical protein
MPWQVKCKTCNYLITASHKDFLKSFMAKHQQRHKQARFSEPWVISWRDYADYNLFLKHNPAFWYEFNNTNKSVNWIAEALQNLFQ